MQAHLLGNLVTDVLDLRLERRRVALPRIPQGLGLDLVLLELLRDGGVAKSAQNHVLPVTDRAFHSVRTRDVRRCPEARCFVLVDGYGTTATTGFSESSKEAATAFRADRRLRGVPNAYNESMSGSIFPEKLHSFLHCTLHDSEVAAAAGVAGSESVFLATVPMMTAGHQTDKGGVFADTFVQGMMNQRSTTKFMMTAVETKMPHDGDVREKREEMLPELEAKMKQYAEGEHFIQSVEGHGGMELLDKAWAEPANVPSIAEIRDPSQWIERVGAPAPAALISAPVPYMPPSAAPAA